MIKAQTVAKKGGLDNEGTITDIKMAAYSQGLLLWWQSAWPYL